MLEDSSECSELTAWKQVKNLEQKLLRGSTSPGHSFLQIVIERSWEVEHSYFKAIFILFKIFLLQDTLK